jgi:hypothetical protein
MARDSVDISSEKTATACRRFGRLSSAAVDVFAHGHALGDVHGERGLAHGGTGGEDDHFAAAQSFEFPVEIGEAVGGRPPRRSEEKNRSMWPIVLPMAWAR